MPLHTFLKLFSLIIFISNFVLSESNFEFSGNLRLRAERQDGFDILSYGKNLSDDFILSRFRFNFKLNFSNELFFYLQIQDSRVGGTHFENDDFKGKNNPFSDPLDINQFYLRYNFLKKFELKLGRQSISFSDRRIFGPGEWGNTGRYIWDAIKLKYENKNLECNILYGSFILHNPDTFPDKRLKDTYGFSSYNQFKFKNFNLDFFYVLQKDNRGITKGEFQTSNTSANYSGFRFSYNFYNFEVDSTFVKEWGNFGGDKIDAYGIVFNFGYFLNRNSKINFQYVLGSGDKNPYDGKHNTFDGAYGGADTVLYGWMNLFFFKNIIEYRLELENKFSKKTELKVEYHYFLLEEKKDGWYSPSKLLARDKSGKSGKNLGAEIDLILNYNYSNNLKFIIGSCFFKPYEFIRKQFEESLTKWHFIQSTINF